MINHQLEALQSEAWGPMTEEQTLDFARRVRELLEAQEFETGYGRFEDLPDIVRHICGHAEAIERRQYGPPPWQTELADFIKQAHEERLEEVRKERVKLLLKYPYLGSVIMALPDLSYKTPEEIAEFNKAMKESASDFVINDIIIAAGNKPEDGAGVWELSPPLTNRFIVFAPDMSGSVTLEDLDATMRFDECDAGNKESIRGVFGCDLIERVNGGSNE